MLLHYVKMAIGLTVKIAHHYDIPFHCNQIAVKL